MPHILDEIAGLPVTEIVRRYPQTLGTLESFRIDTCCGPARTLDEMVVRYRLDRVLLLDALRPAVEEIGAGTHSVV